MSRIPVLIVDDDRIFLDDMRTLIDWEAGGFDVSTASNGRQALAKIRQNMPRIVITDIRMPVMDGMELTRTLHDMDCGARILLLSSYGEFEYAKKAIACGVTEYLLKNEMTAELLSAKMNALKEELSQSGAAPFVPLPASGPVSLRMLNHVVLEEDLPLPVLQFSSEPGVTLAHLAEALQTIDVPGWQLALIGDAGHNRLLLCFDGDGTEQAAKWAEEACRQIRDNLQFRFQRTFSMFPLCRPMTLQQFQTLLGGYVSQMDARFTEGVSRICVLPETPERPAGTPAAERSASSPEWNAPLQNESDALDLNELADLAALLDIDGIVERTERYFRWIRRTGSRAHLLMTVRRFVIHLENQMERVARMSADDDLPSTHASEAVLYSLDDVRNWVRVSCESLIRRLRFSSEERLSPPVAQAIRYIRQHYRDKEIAIHHIAEHVALSEGRLGVLFRKETGRTVNEYLTSVRISNACRILRESSCKVYEIADMVGYGSSQYFSQIFVQHVGKSPNDYRKTAHR